MIKLEIEAENGKDLRRQLEEILGEYRGDSPVHITVSEPAKEEEAPKEEKTTKKKTRKPYERQPTEEKEEKPETEEQSEEEEASAEENSDDQPTLDMLIPLLVEKNRNGNKDKTKALLAKYGVERLTKLDKQHYKDFYSKLQKI